MPRADRPIPYLRDDRGQSAVELALILPWVFLLVIMVFQFGIYFMRWNNATQVAAQGARLAAVDRTGISAPLLAQLCDEIASGKSGTQITLVRPDAAQGKPVTVSVNNPYTFDIPLLGNIVNAVAGTRTFTIRGSATMRGEAPIPTALNDSKGC